MSHVLLWKVSAAFLALFPKPPFVYGLHWAAAGPHEPAAAEPAAAEPVSSGEDSSGEEAAAEPVSSGEDSSGEEAAAEPVSSGEDETLATRKQHSPLPPLFEAL